MSLANQIEGDVQIHPSARLGVGNVLRGPLTIGSGTQIGNHNVIVANRSIQLGRDNFLGHHNVLQGNIRIGDRNHFENFISIGCAGENPSSPWEKKPELYESDLVIEIGSDNFFKEFITVQHPIRSGSKIADKVYVMSHSHLAHDIKLHEGVTISTNCILGGHSIYLPYANVGLSTTTHQRTTIGAFCMIAMGSVVVKDIPPFLVYVAGKLPRVNTLGLERARFMVKEEDIIRYYSTHATVHPEIQKHGDMFHAVRFPERPVWTVSEFRSKN